MMSPKHSTGEPFNPDALNPPQESLNQILEYLLSRPVWDEARFSEELFDDIFADRVAEIHQFERACVPMLGNAVLFIGRMGVGKSGLLHKIAACIERGRILSTPRRKVITLTLDLQDETPTHAGDLFLTSVELFCNLLRNEGALHHHELNAPREVAPMRAVHLVAEELTKWFRQTNGHVPYIFFFVDDLDYAPEVWYDLVMGLSPILSLPFVTAVYAVRPALASKMFGCTDQRIKRILSDATRVELPTLPISEVITKRLSDLVQDRHKPWWQRLWEKFAGVDDRLYSLLESVSFRREGTFKYPFAPKFERFLEKSTNGNTMIMLAMAKTALKYIVDNRTTFAPGPDNLYHFNRGLVLELFGDCEGTPIVNLNSERFLSYNPHSREKSGNPLLLNVLEWVNFCKGSDAECADAFRRLGHSVLDVSKGVEECLALQLIEQRIDSAAVDAKAGSIHSYALTPKGRYHLTHMITWKEYGERFGEFKARIDRAFYKKRLPEQAMFVDIVEFLKYLAEAVLEAGAASGEKPTEIHTTYGQILKAFVAYQSTYFSPDAGELYSPDNPEGDFMIDEAKLRYLLHNPPMDIKVRIEKLIVDTPIVVGKYELHPQKSPHPDRVHLSIKHIRSVAQHLGYAKYSQLNDKDRCDFEFFRALAGQVKVV